MAAAVQSSLSTLLKRTSLGDPENDIKACDSILKRKGDDLEAQHVKAVALLKLDRFQEVARLFEDSGKRLKEKAPLEYSYTLYKVGRLSEAAKVASTMGGSRAARHVEAQAVWMFKLLSVP